MENDRMLLGPRLRLPLLKSRITPTRPKLVSSITRYRFSSALTLLAFLVLGTSCLTSSANAGTILDFWHSYTHQPSGVTHYSFHIANYKRGLFFGSCGPSAKSLQWEYDMDLTGCGPIYHKEQIAFTVEGKVRKRTGMALVTS